MEQNPVDPELTPLERTCLESICNSNWPGNYSLENIRVHRRGTRNGYRIIKFDDLSGYQFKNGEYETCWQSIEMEGVNSAIIFKATVISSSLACLEFFENGDKTWDGEERAWRLVG